MKLIPLSRGLFAQIDDNDYERVNQFKWCAMVCKKGKNKWYVVRNIKVGVNKWKHQMLHRFIMNEINPEIFIDHWDHNGLNCQKVNLRSCSCTQNNGNRVHIPTENNPYKGVSWDKRLKKYNAQISINNKTKYLGLHQNAEDAAIAYNRAALEYFGEFALLNTLIYEKALNILS